MDEEASASSLFFHASHDSSQSGAIPPRVTQLAASFRLHEEEIAFFDAVIDSLPRASYAFQQLKRAYDLQSKNPNWMSRIAEALQFSLEETSAVDARLWNTLLALVQVRGQTWAERWDSVRVSLGLDPRNDTERWNLPTDYSFQEQMPESSNTWLATGLSSQSTAARFRDKPLSSMQGMSLGTTESSIETDTSSAFGQNESVIDLQHVWRPNNRVLSRSSVLHAPRNQRNTHQEKNIHKGLGQELVANDYHSSHRVEGRTASSWRPRSLGLSSSKWDQAMEKDRRWLLQKTFSRWKSISVGLYEIKLLSERLRYRYVSLKYFSTWRTALKKVVRRERASIEHADNRLKMSSFHHWVGRLNIKLEEDKSRRRERLRSAAQLVEFRHDQATVGVAWTVRSKRLTQLWKYAYDWKLSRLNDEEHLLRRTFQRWRLETYNLIRITKQKALLQRHFERRLMHSALQHWRKKAAIRQKCTTADCYLRNEKLYSAWQRWVAQLQRVCSLDQQAAELSKQHSYHRLRSLFSRWRIRHRSAITSESNEFHLLQASWQKWWTRFTERTIRLKITEATAIDKLMRYRLDSALRRWQKLRAHVKRQGAIAERSYTLRLLWKAMTFWKAKRTKIQQSSATAGMHDRESILRTTWAQWRNAAFESVARRWSNHRDRLTAEQAFQAWRLRFAESHHRKTSEVLFMSRSDARLQRNTLQKWMFELRRNIERQSQAAKLTARASSFRTFRLWLKRLEKIREQQSQAQAVWQSKSKRE